MPEIRSVRDQKQDWLECHVFGHEWEPFMKLGRRSDWGRVFSLRCARCGCERHDTIDLQGNLSTREYVYPEGYVRLGDMAERRIELLRRAQGKRRLRAV
jgi:hypothetical protein